MEDWVLQLKQYAETALRPLDGKLDAPGLASEVEVLTDEWGVPHVFAQNLPDLYFAQGFLHAAERLWQIELTWRAAQGRLSELFGEFTLSIDRFFRTLGLGGTARSWVRDADPDTRRVAGSYFAGFNAAAEALPRPLEYEILGLDPDIPATEDEAIHRTFSIAMIMSFTLSPNWEFELLRARLAAAVGEQRMSQLSPLIGPEATIAFPHSSHLSALHQVAGTAGAWGPGVGSNNWVISGSKSETGKPLLANDPHLRIQMPGVWMEMHLSCPEMEVAGVSLPGTPGIIIGHNRSIAWGFTNTQADIADLYAERLSEDGARYEFAGDTEPVEIRREEIFVRHEDEPRIHEVRSTRHGPLITSHFRGSLNPVVIEDSIPGALAFRWIQYEVPSTQRAIEGLNLASNFEEFRAAASLWPIAGQNMVFADVEGNIGYQFTGTVPLRQGGISSTTPLPGWTGEHEWVGTIPFDELPVSFNPDTGFIATANNRVVGADYPHYLTNDWEPPFRIRRIVSLLTEKERLNADDMARIQGDTHSGIADALLPLLLAAGKPGGGGGSAFETVATWDRRMAQDSAGAAIFAVWVSQLAAIIFRPILGDDLFEDYFRTRAWTTLWGYDALEQILTNPEARWFEGSSENVAPRDEAVKEAFERAVAFLEGRFGKDPARWRWGALHLVHFRHPTTTAMPPLDELMSAGPFEVGGGDDTINRGVFNPGEDYGESAYSSYRQIIDLSDFDRSRSVVAVGNSGNPASDHYRDQAELWATGGHHPMPFSRAAVEDATKGRLLLNPS